MIRSARSRSPHGAESGFTLLEILVVLVVLGFLMVGLAQGVRAGILLWNAQTHRVSETSELDASARVLRALLSGIAASPSAAAAPGAVAQIKGTADSLAFVGDLPTGLGTTQRADITLEVSGGRLQLRWRRHRHELSIAPAPQPAETELSRGIDHLDLAYWGSPSADRPAGWQTEWDGPGIPELIRVRMRFVAGDRRHWPDLIVATQL